MSITYPVSARIYIKYEIDCDPVFERVVTIIETSLTSDVSKKVMDYINNMLLEKLDSLKNISALKAMLTLFS